METRAGPDVHQAGGLWGDAKAIVEVVGGLACWAIIEVADTSAGAFAIRVSNTAATVAAIVSTVEICFAGPATRGTARRTLIAIGIGRSLFRSTDRRVAFKNRASIRTQTIPILTGGKPAAIAGNVGGNLVQAIYVTGRKCRFFRVALRKLAADGAAKGLIGIAGRPRTSRFTVIIRYKNRRIGFIHRLTLGDSRLCDAKFSEIGAGHGGHKLVADTGLQAVAQTKGLVGFTTIDGARTNIVAGVNPALEFAANSGAELITTITAVDPLPLTLHTHLHIIGDATGCALGAAAPAGALATIVIKADQAAAEQACGDDGQKNLSRTDIGLKHGCSPLAIWDPPPTAPREPLFKKRHFFRAGRRKGLGVNTAAIVVWVDDLPWVTKSKITDGAGFIGAVRIGGATAAIAAVGGTKK